MLEWRIYYDDCTTFDNTQGEPEHCSAYGIIAIVCYDESGDRLVLQKWNNYYAKDLNGKPVWYGSDDFGLKDQLASDINRDIHGVKFGRTISNFAFNDIIAQASHDPDFPRGQKAIFREQPKDIK